ncbi:MAG TPA: hypothetical protein RMH80_03220 [Polyangiaceae bacterium LLY-WYZ-15_(1-7)]|nr:hypothetical protein [Polyangiaceae bacterium LLY-WYZ-15_(1-7)]
MRRVLLAFACLVLACGGGEKETGEACAGDSDCARGLCAAGVVGPEPVCTVSCGSSEDCPEGWTCSGATQDNVLVCRRGAATPFGQ